MEDGLGNTFVFLSSSVHDHNSKCAVPLLSQIDIKGCHILGDKAYEAKAIQAYIDLQNATYTITPKSDVNAPWLVDWYIYKERYLVEYFFQKLGWFHRVVTRYDKLDASFLAFVHVMLLAFC